MGMFGQLGKAVLNQAGINLLGVDFQGQARRREQEAALRRAQMEAAGLLAPVPGAMRQAPIANAEGADISAAFSPVLEQGPSRRLGPAEIAAQLGAITARTPGFNPAPWKDLATLAKPDLTAVEGVLVDKGDPSNINREITAVEKGQRRVYDADGRFVGVVDADGYLQSLASRKEAETMGGVLGGLQTVGDGKGGTVTITGREFLGAPGRGLGGIGYTPPAAQLSADKITADARAQSAIDLPGDLQTAQSTLDVIEQLKNHPGRKFGTGGTGVIPAMPGTEVKDFTTLLDQAKGKTFLEAFASLKGGGQITEREGQAAQAAIARLDRTQSEEGFLRALAELENIVRAGMQRSQQRAGATPAASSPPRSAVEAELRRRGLIR